MCLCGVQTVQQDIDDIQRDILRIKDVILMEVEGMADADKSQFLRSEIGGITQRLSLLYSSLSAYLQRYNDTHMHAHTRTRTYTHTHTHTRTNALPYTHHN